MAKNPALLKKKVDSTDMQGLLLTLNTMIDHAGLASNDKHKLLALVQDKQTDTEEDSELGAPAGAKYETHSDGYFHTYRAEGCCMLERLPCNAGPTDAAGFAFSISDFTRGKLRGNAQLDNPTHRKLRSILRH